ncbi:MAG TPA: hypothetical protein VHZ76_07260, partial [Gammaproteobacteria bacterium]|nr:hypothetical protein [Gammaproteobacteria bacterium]
MLSFVTLPTPDTLNSSLKEYPAVVKILNEIYQNIPANKKIYNIVQLRNTLQSLNITNEFLTSLIERVNLFVCFCLGCDLTNLTKEINSFIKDFYIGADRITPLYPNSPIAKAINDYHEIYSSKNSKEKPPFKEFRKKYISEAIKKGEIVVQRTNPQINDWVCGTQKYKKANRDEKFLVFPCNSSMYGQGFVHITTGENSELAISSFSSESYHDIRGA